jgi:multidrug resistance efflux pump
MTEAPIDSRAVRLSALLQLEQEARQAATPTELGFVIVNETHRLIPYQRAVLWRMAGAGGVRVEAVSGLAELERHSPYLAWVRKLFKTLSSTGESHACRIVESEELPEQLRQGWSEWCPGPAVWCPFVGKSGGIMGGFWLVREQSWEPGEITLLERVTDAYGHAWDALDARRTSTFRGRWFNRFPGRSLKLVILAGAIGSLFIPVRLSVLAPADVIPVQPVIVSSPIEGAIQSISVRPNQSVEQGDLLFSLDDAALSSRHEVAQKALAVAEADYLRAVQKAFNDAASKAEVAMRKAVVDEKTAELAYTQRLLGRVAVRAPRSGISVFGDPNDWLGKPVAVGEKVMTIADPGRTEAQAWVPVEDAINLEPGAEMRLFLNTDPTRPLEARIYESSYEAKINAAGLLAFQVKARFEEGQQGPRIGLKGTAKIYGETVSLGYYLLRRPIAAGRQFFGL